MKNWFHLFPFVSICFLLTGCDFEESVELHANNTDRNKILENVLASLDPEYPGRGLADYPSDESTDIPKGYAMILLGAQAEAKRENSNINDLGVKAGDWLIENADANNNGIIGWGVPIAWDAYGDGSINPENTEYTISTAIVVDALLGWLDYVDDEKKQIILDLIDEALMPYLEANMSTPAGLLPYSLMVNDREYDTFNSAVYLAGQMQRYSEIVISSELREELKSTANKTIAALVENKNIYSKTGSWYWDYSIQETNPNDLPHAGYIIEGVFTYIEYNGDLASDLDKDKIFNHLMDFLENDGQVRGWPVFRPDITTPPRLYDLSIAAHLLCTFKDKVSGDLFLDKVERYAISDGYLKYPRGMESNRQVAEYEAYLYRALMSCGLKESGDA